MYIFVLCIILLFKFFIVQLLCIVTHDSELQGCEYTDAEHVIRCTITYDCRETCIWHVLGVNDVHVECCC